VEYYILKPQWSSRRYTPLAAQARARREAFCYWSIFFILGHVAKLRWAGGGAQRPVWRANESKKTGARSARARTRGQNPLVDKYEVEKKKMG
jgi:hypothetical protein